MSEELIRIFLPFYDNSISFLSRDSFSCFIYDLKTSSKASVNPSILSASDSKLTRQHTLHLVIILAIIIGQTNKQTPQRNGLDMQWKLVQAGRVEFVFGQAREGGLSNAVTVVEKKYPLKVSERGKIRNEDIITLLGDEETLSVADWHGTHRSNSHEQIWRDEAFGNIST